MDNFFQAVSNIGNQTKYNFSADYHKVKLEFELYIKLYVMLIKILHTWRYKKSKFYWET